MGLTGNKSPMSKIDLKTKHQDLEKEIKKAPQKKIAEKPAEAGLASKSNIIKKEKFQQREDGYYFEPSLKGRVRIQPNNNQ
jgi:hypothetical protein